MMISGKFILPASWRGCMLSPEKFSGKGENNIDENEKW